MAEENILDKVYDHKNIEQKHYKFWEEQKYFNPDHSKKEVFSIVIPPPNVTGALHMGHALDNTLQDILVRWHRMKAHCTLWVPGTDHAGIATQNVVEKQLHKEGKSRHDLGREEFIKKVWHWKEEYGDRITKQLRLLGCSCDWDHERFTMDEGCSKAVRKVFVELFKEGLIFRGKRIINWCPRCHTALSDVEVEYQEQKGSLWHIKYPIVGKAQKYIVVATTRPETMLGDTAVAVNPEDERYKTVIGKKIKLPLTDREIPIIADEMVDKDFGTGAVKVTPAHDANDFEMGKKHNLPQLVIMDTNGVMNENCPAHYRGLDRYKARELIVEDLRNKGLLAGVDDYENKISTCYRCRTVVEPYVSEQWFVDMPKLAGPAIEAVKTEKIKFYPERWAKVYFDWMENIKEWCISRQIWWGHRIPVWYCECGEIICEMEDPKFCPKCQSSKLTQDEDVLDTWFSSALWPFSTLGWPEETADLKKFYPTSALVTGYDIITFWVSRMITMGLKFRQVIPFKNVVIHGLIRDEHGKKMSKSTGNAVDPVELINEYGADALRFTLTSMVTSSGQDLKLSANKVLASRNFNNKLWNVTRYVLMKLQENKFNPVKTPADEWIISRCQKTIASVENSLRQYYFGEAASNLYDFAWSEFCDWYIEFSKLGCHKETLVYVLGALLKLLHPIIPFITEELWLKLGNQKSLMLEAWPLADQKLINETLEKEIEMIIALIKAIRNIRAEMNVPKSKKADVILLAKDEATKSILEKFADYIKLLASVDKIEIVTKLAAKPRDASYAAVSFAEIYLPLANLIDIGVEVERLEKEITKLEKEVDRIKKKLSNNDFIQKAPPEIITAEKEKEKGYAEKIIIIKKQLEMLKN